MQVLSAIITASFALIGTALTVFWGNRHNEKNVIKNTDVIIYRLNVLEKKVDDLSSALMNTKREQKSPIIKRQFSVVRAQNRV